MALTLTIIKENESTSNVKLKLLDNNVVDLVNVYNVYRVLRGKAEKIATKTINKPNNDPSSENLEFDDTKCLDVNVPSVPSIKDKVIRGGMRVFYEYLSEDAGTNYEYYIERHTANNRVIKSNTVGAYTITGLNGYEYAVISTDGERKGEIPMTKDWVFTKKEDFTYELKYAGYNSVFIRSVDNAGNKSQSVIDDIYIEIETVVPVKSGAVPHAVKYNNRYRGPHESKKVDNLYNQVKFNLKKIRARLEELEKKKDAVLEKPVNYNSKIIAQSDYIEELYEKLKNR